MKNLLIGISGGTGSGKTSFAKEIMRRFPGNEIVLMDQDSYYKDLGHLPLEDRKKINFDHPNSVDFDMLIHHMRELKKGNPVEKPVYDYVAHTRKPDQFTRIEPRDVLIRKVIL